MDSAKPAYALAGLFGLWYALGTAVQYRSIVLPVAFLGILGVWILAVIADLRNVSPAARWRSARLRRQFRRRLRRTDPGRELGGSPAPR